MIYFGIDNGLTGGISAISDAAGAAPINMLPMPIKAKGKGNELDAAAVCAWIKEVAQSGPFLVIIEQPGGAKSAKAASSMADSFGALRSMCEVLGWRHHRITPQSWQKVMLPNCQPGNTKAFALSVVRRLWPEETWLATPRCRTPHDGMIDAALIAEWARQKQL